MGLKSRNIPELEGTQQPQVGWEGKSLDPPEWDLEFQPFPAQENSKEKHSKVSNRSCCIPVAPGGNKNWEFASQQSQNRGKLPQLSMGINIPDPNAGIPQLLENFGINIPDPNPGIPQLLGWFYPSGIPNIPKKTPGSREAGSLWKLPWEFQPWIQGSATAGGWKNPWIWESLWDFFPVFLSSNGTEGFP